MLCCMMLCVYVVFLCAVRCRDLTQIHLQHVGENKTAAIMKCFHSIKDAEIQMVKKQASLVLQEEKSALLDQVTRSLTAQGVVADLSQLQTQFFSPTHCTEGLGVIVAPKSNKRKENRRGDKTIEGRNNFQTWPAEKKLEFIDHNADFSTGDYAKGCRSWLIRVNPIAKCFRDCCNRNVDAFLLKHGNDKGNFSASSLGASMSGCEHCKKATD